MFKLKSQIHNCKIPKIVNDDIFFVRDNNIVKADKFFTETILSPIREDYSYSNFISDSSFYLTSHGVLYSYALTSGNIETYEIGDYSSILTIINDSTVIGISEGETRNLFSYDLGSKSKKWSMEVGFCYIVVNKDKAIRTNMGDDSKIQIYALEDGELIIEYDAQKLDTRFFDESRFTNVRLFHNNSVIVSMPDSTLVSLNLDYHKVEWYSKGINILVKYFEERLYNLNTDTFIIAAANTGRIEKEISVINQYKSCKIEMASTNTLFINDSHVFFTDNWNCKIAALNIENGEIEWVYKLETQQGATLPYSPILKNDRMYIQDSNNTFYIFEKSQF